MDLRRFYGDEHSHQEVHEQLQPQGVCWCKGSSNLEEVAYHLVAQIKPSIGEEVDKVLTRLLVPYQSLLQSLVLPPNSSSLPHQAESSASRRFRLQFKSNIPDDSLFTMAKIEEQGASFEVELLDELGRKVEYDLESPVRIKIDVLNGDFDVEDTDWTQEDYNENIAKSRQYRGELLKGERKMALSKGVVSLGHLRITDNSSYMTNKMFRLGATVEGLFPEMVIKAAVSQKFRVKERRLKGDGKLKEPSEEDALCCLVGIGKNGPVYDRARKAGVSTVKDFLQRLDTNPKELKNILKVPEVNWNAIVKNAKACKSPEKINEGSPQISDQELTNRPYSPYRPCDIQPRQGPEQWQQPAPPPLPPSASSCEGRPISSQMYNISHTHIDQYQVPFSSTTTDQGPICGSTHENDELYELSAEFLEGLLLDDYIQNNSPQEGERGSVSGDLGHDRVTSKLLAACYVTKAATLFMVSIQQDSSAPRKKRKLQ